MGERMDLMRQVFAIEAEARRIERARCVELLRRAAMDAQSVEVAACLGRVADAIEAPDAG